MTDGEIAPRDESWAALVARAEADDAAYDPSKTWVPPIGGALVRAARRSRLCRLDPFTSMNRLCFRRAPFALGEDEVAPAHIEIGPEPEYRVFSGSPYGSVPIMVLRTTDATEAVAKTVELLHDLLESPG